MSLISAIPVRIDEIRSEDENPGLKDFEIRLLQIAEKLTNGTVIDISYTGTTVLFKPGVIIGGRIEHSCPVSRGIGYYLEFILALAPFAKKTVTAILKGVTNNNVDLTVDTIRTVTLPQFKHFGILEGLELSVIKRGAPPLGGGEVKLVCPSIRKIEPTELIDCGHIKRIRGIAYSTRVSPQTANRMVDAAKRVLGEYSQDIYLYTDVYKGAESGLSPGYGLSLVAESDTGAYYSAELCAEAMETPEDLGQKCAHMLLSEVSKGGYFDTYHHWIPLLFMTLSSEDVSKTIVGELNPFTVQYLRDLRDFFNVTFRVQQSKAYPGMVDLTCVGTGYTNVNKKTL